MGRPSQWSTGERQICIVTPKSPLVTPKSEARSEISVKFGIYKVKVDFCPLFTSPIYRGEVNSGRIYIGDVTSGHENF